MTATNHTKHYGLSQYMEDDHPTYTGDYNVDMSKIDAAIYAASQSGGIAAVAHADDLTGDGTDSSPLGVADTIARTEDIPSLDGYATTESVTQAIAAAIADRLTAGDIKPGNGINVETSGNTVIISYVGGGSGGLTAVAHDDTLTGNGTTYVPLEVMRGGLLSNSIPANTVNIDSIDNSSLNTFAQVNTRSAGTKPVSSVEGLCIRYRASPLAVVEVIFSNDNDANIYIRRNYSGVWRAWRTVAMLDDLTNLTSRIATLESQVAALTAAATPSATGLTAEELDTQYLDNYNIVRAGTPTHSNETEESSQ